jgi:hypothetical protein
MTKSICADCRFAEWDDVIPNSGDCTWIDIVGLPACVQNYFHTSIHKTDDFDQFQSCPVYEGREG